MALLPRYSDVRSILFHRALAHEPPLLLVGLAEGQLLVVALAEEDLHFHVRSTVVVSQPAPPTCAQRSVIDRTFASDAEDVVLTYPRGCCCCMSLSVSRPLSVCRWSDRAVHPPAGRGAVAVRRVHQLGGGGLAAQLPARRHGPYRAAHPHPRRTTVRPSSCPPLLPSCPLHAPAPPPFAHSLTDCCHCHLLLLPSTYPRTVVPLSPAITRSPDGPQPSLAWLDPTSCLCFGSISHCLTGRATSQPVQQVGQLPLSSSGKAAGNHIS